MTDFLNAIQSGIDSAINREKNFLEIHNIFFLVKNELENFSQGNIEVALNTIIDNGLVLFGKDYFEDQTELYKDKILNINKKTKYIHHKLTTIYFDRYNGYPCTIYIDGDEFTCVNKETLEDNIKKLLSSPKTGSILYSLIKE